MARKVLDLEALAQKVYLDADEETIRDLALALLKVVRLRAGKRQREIRTIPDSEVNDFACLMLDRCQSNGIPPPKNLTALIRVQLRRDRQLSINRGYLLRKQLVLTYRRNNPKASLRQIAKATHVDHTTVRRWLMEANISTSQP